METLNEILQIARERAEAKKLPYAGELTPEEAHRVLELASAARLVDVRSQAELYFVGRIPQAEHIEWAYYPGWAPNPAFTAQLEAQVNREALVMFICRSGARSHKAATMASEAGFPEAYNVAQGFEGDADPAGHRGNVNGWKAAGLPWVQG
ncbi:MAG TPA: rhodanese-like domain-containing protein [Methylophilaceae bacterium]|nr:rhodanese-like domain-containing protein [Methylophilaceae bacterium]